MEHNLFSSLNFILILSCTGVYIGIKTLLKSPYIHLFEDKPEARKIHQEIIPRAGGICIICTFLLILFFWNTFLKTTLPVLENHILFTIIGITIGIFILGFFDDTIFIEIDNRIKIIYEMSIVAIILTIFQIHFDIISIFPGKYFSLGWLGIPLTVLWVTGVTNAINMIDGIDGLAGSVTIISFIGMGVLAGIAGQYSIVILCIICIALLLGFLIHNRSPAKIFLGDTGSLFFGIILGVLTVYIVTTPETNYSILSAPLLVGFPLLDLLLTMIRRYVKAFLTGKSCYRCIKSMFIADNGHIHHRLLNKRLSHTKICTLLSLYSFILCTSAIIVSFTPIYISIMILSYLCIITIIFLLKLNFFNQRFNNKTYL